MPNCQMSDELYSSSRHNWSVFPPSESSSELLKWGSPERQHSEHSMFGFEYTPRIIAGHLTRDKWHNNTLPQFLPLYDEDGNSTSPMQWLGGLSELISVLNNSTITQFLAILCIYLISMFVILLWKSTVEVNRMWVVSIYRYVKPSGPSQERLRIGNGKPFCSIGVADSGHFLFSVATGTSDAGGGLCHCGLESGVRASGFQHGLSW